jgi:stringent starvation protein B
MENMTSNRPYLIRAVYDWLVDNGLTPHLLVDAEGKDVSVPAAFVENGKIVLNVAPRAVRDIYLGNDMISFSARFNGVPTEIFVPPASVLGIYARENDVGMLFTPEQGEVANEAAGNGEEEQHQEGADAAQPPRPPKGRPTLKVIK